MEFTHDIRRRLEQVANELETRAAECEAEEYRRQAHQYRTVLVWTIADSSDTPAATLAATLHQAAHVVTTYGIAPSPQSSGDQPAGDATACTAGPVTTVQALQRGADERPGANDTHVSHQVNDALSVLRAWLGQPLADWVAESAHDSQQVADLFHQLAGLCRPEPD